MEYDPDSTAVVVVDMQNDFCHPEGALYAEASEAALEPVQDVLDVAVENDLPVWFTTDTHEEGAAEFEQWGEHCLQGGWGWLIHQDVADGAWWDDGQSRIVSKDTYDAFHETNFERVLNAQGIERLIICGTLVNVCVQETASSAALHGFDVTVVEDAVGYLSEEQKQASLEHIEFLIGDTASVADL